MKELKKWKQIFSIFLLVNVLFFFSSCQLLGPDRSFIDEMENQGESFFSPERDFPVVAGDEGQLRPTKRERQERTPLSPKEKAKRKFQSSLKDELKQLEEALTDQEYQHYQQHKSKFTHPSERIYFLRLNNMRERDEYLLGKGHFKDYLYTSPAEAEAIREREIVVGMSKNAVVQSWGRPMRIEVAGDPRFENERWAFYEYGRLKYVFFENGIVRGWMVE